MGIIRPGQGAGGGGGGGGGGGTVTNVSSADTSIVVTSPTTTPVLQLGSLTTIAANEGGTVPIANLQDPTAGKVIGSNSGAAAVFPPGYEINYTAITSPVNITDTSEATATALISPGAITFDGTLVLCTFYCQQVVTDTASASDSVTISLFEGATQITRLANCHTVVTATPNMETVYAAYRFTPTAGSHTYKITAFANSTTGTPKLTAGTGGTSGAPPCYVRFQKV